jgi:hypothetical protein
MTLEMQITEALTGVNVLLLLSIIYVYLVNLRKSRSQFTYGLLAFALLFLIQDAVSFYFYYTMMPYYSDAVGLQVLILTGLQTIAFGLLNWLTWK